MSTIELGKSLYLRRTELGVTQQHVADLSGISSRLLVAWENGHGNPGFKQLSAVLAVLGLQMNLTTLIPA
jgi:transcriptional regulator with XRE-family HTH domain